ncbi:MAG TPA: PatB family C-S lyase [Burkholderiales bacterium]|nr:PatB family C-S lyase [Burkholderiales bacterium]
MSVPEFDFDRQIDRRATSSVKWEKYRGRDVIPMWVADMDFATAPCVVEELEHRIRHGVFGYTQVPEELPHVIAAAMLRDFDWRIEPDWIVFLPSLVVGLNVVCRAFAREGEEVITAVPIYPPFLSAPEYGNRNCIRVPLREKDGRWYWDLDALEAAITAKSRVLLVCSPHNPTGRVWNAEELRAVAGLAVRHGLILVSDEIHGGLVLDTEKRHVPMASLDPSIAGRTVTLMSASKTFNLPGLGCAFAIVADPALRARLQRTMAGIVHHVGALGLFATLAAYRDGREWQLALCHYLRGNRDLVESTIGTLPSLRVYHVEATYLAWIDARTLPGGNPVQRFEQAGVGLYDGALFGGPGFVRLNFACPRPLLREALSRLQRALV